MCTDYLKWLLYSLPLFIQHRSRLILFFRGLGLTPWFVIIGKRVVYAFMSYFAFFADLQKRGPKPLKKLFFSLVILVVLSCLLGSILLSVWSQTIFEGQGRTPQARDFILKEKESLHSLSERLARDQFINHSFLFKVFVRLKYDYKSFQAGRYLFLAEDTPEMLAEKMLKGDTYNEVVLKITLPEGFSLSQVIERLRDNGYDQTELERLSQDQDFLTELNLSSSSLEGYLYPSTYIFYNQKPSEKEIYTEMVKKFFSELSENYLKRLEVLGLSLEESVIIASLIEKETSLEEEKPLISEVIFNRLKMGMTLGIDASVSYGIKDFNGNLTHKDLRNNENLYNTRVHKGLPPSSICNPSKTSLEAVIKPSQEGYLYYVLKPGASQKSHQFSKSLSEHNKHVKNLLKK